MIITLSEKNFAAIFRSTAQFCLAFEKQALKL